MWSYGSNSRVGVGVGEVWLLLLLLMVSMTLIKPAGTTSMMMNITQTGPQSQNTTTSIVAVVSNVTKTVPAGYFHAYKDPNWSRNPTIRKGKCKAYLAQHKHTDLRALAHKYKLWPTGNHHHKHSTTSVIFGLEYSLGEIWKHQHPANCSNVQFFISSVHGGGFGSTMHVYGADLGIAMELGRVYLQNPFTHEKIHWETSNEFCRQQNKSNIECYYEPASSCTIYDAFGPNALDILYQQMNDHTGKGTLLAVVNHTTLARLHDPATRNKLVARYQSSKAIIINWTYRLRHYYLPTKFHSLVPCSSIPSSNEFYWWRIVSTAYLMRPNARSMAWIEAHKLKDFEANASQAVGVYVRRGDKSIEMQLVPVTTYTNAIDMLWNEGYLRPDPTHNHSMQASNPSPARSVFLASEDSKVIKEMQRWNKNHTNYYMRYTNVFDRSGLYAEKDHNSRLKNNHPEYHPDEYLNMLLQIHYMIRAQALVCTLASNFCRIIDELRASVAGRADRPFVDLSVETCKTVPCVYTGIYNFGW